MKLGTVRIKGAPTLVVEVGGAPVVPRGTGLGDVADAIGRWAEVEPALAEAIRSGAHDPVPGEVEWLPPVVRPGKVVAVALNNSANKERIITGPSHPATFIKPNTSLLGHGQPVRLRPEYGRVHPEPELAVIIGRQASEVSTDDAMDYVFGYTIMNDLTSPTMRDEDTFHYRAIHPKEDGTEGIRYVETWVTYPGRYKSANGFGPIGPWVVTADEIPDPHDLTVTCIHQGRTVTEDSTENLFYSVRDVISFCSSYSTLEAGDVVSMGTALKASGSGGGAVQNVDLNRLGGPIEVEISGVGRLTSPVIKGL